MSRSDKKPNTTRGLLAEGATVDADFVTRKPGCVCTHEEGDSPCPVHGDAAAVTPEGASMLDAITAWGERVKADERARIERIIEEKLPFTRTVDAQDTLRDLLAAIRGSDA